MTSAADPRTAAAQPTLAQMLGGQGALLNFAKDAEIFLEGDATDRIFLLVGGAVRTVRILDDGRRQILNYALPSDLVGLQGSLMGEMEHSVEALTDVVLCVFPRSKLWDLYSRFPSLAFDLTWLAAREERLIDENLVSVGRRTALERTAYLLLHLYMRAEEVGLIKNGQFQFPFTQQHMADTLGMSLVHTNKTLKRLSATKTMRWKHRVFEIVDRAGLARIAGNEPARQPARPFI